LTEFSNALQSIPEGMGAMAQKAEVTLYEANRGAEEKFGKLYRPDSPIGAIVLSAAAFQSVFATPVEGGMTQTKTGADQARSARNGEEFVLGVAAMVAGGCAIVLTVGSVISVGTNRPAV